MRTVEKQYAFYFDQSRCMACQACVIACKDWNNIEPGPVKWRQMHDTEEGVYPEPQVYIAVYACNHCENPACVEACAQKAIYKRKADGIVIVDRNKCISLQQCIAACPYSAPQLDPDKQDGSVRKVSKCNMCWDRVSAGMKPSCVNACQMRALDFGVLEELNAKYPSAQSLKNGGTLKSFPAHDRGSDGRILATPTNPSFLFKVKAPRS